MFRRHVLHEQMSRGQQIIRVIMGKTECVFERHNSDHEYTEHTEVA